MNKFFLLILTMVPLLTASETISSSYVGCFQDDSDRDLTGPFITLPNMTVDYCIHYCANNNFNYSGLQYSSYCFCGNAYGRYDELDQSSCNCPCAGNQLESCGCGWSNRIFKINRITTTTTSTTTTTTTTTTPTTSKSSQCSDSDKQCHIYGDPHYKSVKGYQFNVNDDCTYLIASDDCKNNNSSFQIYADHEHAHANVQYVSYLQKVIVKIGNNVYKVGKEVYINGIISALPYRSSDGSISIKEDGQSIIFQSESFNFKFEDQKFILSICSNSICGLCAVDANEDIKTYVEDNNPAKPYCRI